MAEKNIVDVRDVSGGTIADTGDRDEMEQSFAIVTSPGGFIMKLKLNSHVIEPAPATNAIPSIDSNHSEYRMMYPPITESEVTKPFNRKSRSKTPVSRNLQKKMSNPTADDDDLKDNSENIPPSSKIIPKCETETPLAGRVKRVPKKKITEDLEDHVPEDNGQENTKVVSLIEPKITRSAAKRLKLEVGLETPTTFFPNASVTRKRQPKGSSGRSSSQPNSSEAPAPSVNKRPRCPKRTPETDSPPTPEHPEDPSTRIPDDALNVSRNSLPPLNENLAYEGPIVPPQLNYPGVSTPNFLPYHLYSVPLAYLGAPFIPLPTPPVYDTRFMNMPYPGPPRAFSFLPCYYYAVDMPLAYQGVSPYGPPPLHILGSSPNMTLANQLLNPVAYQHSTDYNTHQAYQESVDPIGYSIINESHQEVPQLPVEFRATLAENEINMDFNDPLDFEPTEDVYDQDLMSIIDDNIDYCAKIYNCNPVSNYILLDQLKTKENGSLNTPPGQKNLSVDTNEILIPLHPSLKPEEISQLLQEEALSPQVISFECERCLSSFPDYASARYHIDVTCKKLKVIATSA